MLTEGYRHSVIYVDSVDHHIGAASTKHMQADKPHAYLQRMLFLFV